MQATTPSLTLPEHERRGDRGTRSWSRRASSPGPTMTRPIPQILCYLASRRHGPTSTHQRVLDRTTKCLFFFPPSILYSRAKSCRSPVAAAVALYQKSKGTGPKRRPYKESQTATSATSRPYRLNYYKKTFFGTKRNGSVRDKDDHLQENYYLHRYGDSKAEDLKQQQQ